MPPAEAGTFLTLTLTMTTKTRTPTAVQLAAITTTHPFALALAGPGSGKTFTLASRVQHLVAAGHDPAKMVVITFTNAGAKELQHRLGELGTALGYLGTLHGFALRELTRHGASMGYRATITVLDAEQAEELLVETGEGLGVKGGIKKLQAAREGLAQRGFQGAKTPAEIAVLAYLKKLRAASAVDFDTILHDFLKLVRADAKASVTRWEHLMVDEYQDSGDLDVAIYEAMLVWFRFMVGDPDQAIYGFRGGRVGHIVKLAAAGSGWEVHRLEENYRCDFAVCEAANRLIAHNVNRPQKVTSPRAGCGNGRVDLLSPYASDDAEQADILNAVKAVLGFGDTPANEIAILCRYNGTVRDFTDAAIGMGLPVRQKATSKLPGDWRVARAALELLNAPTSDLAAAQWLRVRYPDQHVEFRAVAARNQWPLIRIVPEDVPALTTPGELPTALARLAISRESIDRVAGLAALIPEPTLAAISFAIARDFESTPEEGHGVTICTMHAAKGREWARVYVVACEQEICPGTSAKRDLEEERRLFYVAATRAKNVLTLSCAERRRATWGQQRHQPATPSQFLAELLPAR